MGDEDETRVAFTDDPSRARREADAFLTGDPVRHNLVLTLLEERAAHARPGRYFVARRGASVVGFLFQSPLDFHAAITPMPSTVIAPLAAAVAEVAPDLPGVSGEAGTAARFAGAWTEAVGRGARPVEGQRLYELAALASPPNVPGRLRRGTADDKPLVLSWLDGFAADTGGHAVDPNTMVHRLAAGLAWFWHHDGPVALASLTAPVAGAARVGPVYTPPEHRRHGYAAACTAAVSRVALDTGATRCVLYTQLGNPQSNAIYRRLGYEAVEELVHYDFG